MKTDQTKPDLSPEDREALERSAEDIRRGRFATDEEVKQLFDRCRPKGRP
jgi:predicted transcriptional regulator